MIGIECLVLTTTGRLISYHVWPRTAKACGARCFMGVDHDMSFGSLLNHIEVMVVHGLRIVMVATGNDVSYIACLHSIVAIFLHQVEGIVQVAFIILG